MGLDFTVIPGQEVVRITHDGIGEGYVSYAIPESIGDVDQPVWTASPEMRRITEWTKNSDGEMCYQWEREGYLEYTAAVSKHKDFIEVRMTLKNLSDRKWRESFSFSCFNTRAFSQFSDFDGTRTYLHIDDQFTPVTLVQRKQSPRPTIQLWYIKDGMRPLGFVENFKATPEVYPDGLLLTKSWDGKHIAAVVSDKPLFLFANLEFSCIHCCPTFGGLAPGEEGTALHRAYLLPNTAFSKFIDLLRTDLPNYK